MFVCALDDTLEVEVWSLERSWTVLKLGWTSGRSLMVCRYLQGPHHMNLMGMEDEKHTRIQVLRVKFSCFEANQMRCLNMKFIEIPHCTSL